MKNYINFKTVCFVVLTAVILPKAAHAQYCSMASSPQQKKALDSIRTLFKVEYGCTGLLGDCLKKVPVSASAKRLENYACYDLVTGKDAARTIIDLEARQSCLNSKDTFFPDISLLETAGNPRAPVMVAVYIGATCPMCHHTVKAIYEALQGNLKDKVLLAPVPFGSRMADVALLAAARNKKFWPYFLTLADMGEVQDEATLIEIAKSVGIPPATFKAQLNNPALLAQLKTSHDAGARVGVNVTPTMYINGRKYASNKNPEWILDALEYEHERILEKKP
jgi:hypothetical protein